MPSSPEFVRALFELSRERGGGYIPDKEIWKRVEENKLKRPPPPPAPRPRIAPPAPPKPRIAPPTPKPMVTA